MIHWGIAFVLVVIALLLGLVFKELWLFFVTEESKTESDDVAEKAFKLAEQIQNKLEIVKTKMNDIQHRYLICQDEKLDWQHRYDVLNIDKLALETKVKALELK